LRVQDSRVLAALHPFLIHFAIGLLLVGPAMDTIGLLLRRETMLLTGRWNAIIGAAILIFVELSGFAAESDLGPHSAAGEALLHLHAALGHLCVAIWVPVALWRALVKSVLPVRLRTLYLVLSYTGAALIFSQAALGAALVYRHGVGLNAAARAEPMVQKPAAPGAIDHPQLMPKN
jgi:uncharacterized membrane protein